jgi:uncharacterized OB-fold protein
MDDRRRDGVPAARGVVLALATVRGTPTDRQPFVPYPLVLVAQADGPRLLARVDAPYETLRVGQPLVRTRHASEAGGFPLFRPVAVPACRAAARREAGAWAR